MGGPWHMRLIAAEPGTNLYVDTGRRHKHVYVPTKTPGIMRYERQG